MKSIACPTLIANPMQWADVLRSLLPEASGRLWENLFMILQLDVEFSVRGVQLSSGCSCTWSIFLLLLIACSPTPTLLTPPPMYPVSINTWGTLRSLYTLLVYRVYNCLSCISIVLIFM